jgi:deazaflavin-dependent oxidoreductase (nitroreductase family)
MERNHMDGTTGTVPAGARDGSLPYGPRMRRALPALYRAFLVANRWFAAPALRWGLGPLFVSPVGGSILLMRTRGRKSGLVREAPLGYVVFDGAVYVCAGFGRGTGWLANLQADPSVEVILPGARFRGIAEEVTDRAEFEAAFPALIRALGTVGRAAVPAIDSDGDAAALWFGPLPLVRIRPTAILPGPWDPGGRGWLVATAAEIAAAGLVLWALRRRPSPGSGGTRKGPAG